jgi:CRP-like cAMP-binding protein
MSDGDAIEVGMVGREGAVGVEASIGTDGAAIDAICQSTGDALIVDATALLPLLPTLPQLEQRLRSQLDVQLRMATRTAACNRFHTVPERLAKWLAFMDDRIPNRPLAVTHDIIAIMLGARRAGITEAAGRLQEQGIIRYAQGRVHILDGERLRNEACACYAVMRDLSQRGIAQAMDVAVGDYAGRAATGTAGGGGSVVT